MALSTEAIISLVTLLVTCPSALLALWSYVSHLQTWPGEYNEPGLMMRLLRIFKLQHSTWYDIYLNQEGQTTHKLTSPPAGENINGTLGPIRFSIAALAENMSFQREFKVEVYCIRN
ncbi:uncharacterized protein MCYG_06202 [Microsporum canis CBS 113480]|uniref:Uncharacterized protein n=1 Tax=Arthroderma otae (strain ATCC MYA-4605 / CBS 113480) TaxID=554155 RepID=C5FTZ9_ARTOC|nr:uncharacterized protein MCYG_06202 [Microsporum canis CBS 113480]EEQ33383.1 predicted protein [Microsporum canis CBS 113480]